MRCGASITLLAATLGSGCIVASSGPDGGSVSNGPSSSSSTSSGGTSAGNTSGTTTGGPAEAALMVSPNPINFGFVPLPTTAVGCTTVTNQAYAAVEILGANDFIDAGAFALSQVDDATPPNPSSGARDDRQWRERRGLLQLQPAGDAAV